jgi:hypothetical protein
MPVPSLPKLRAKNATVRRAHNKFALIMIIVVLLSLFLTLKWGASLPSKSLRQAVIIDWVLIVGGGEIYAIYRLIQRDRELCRQIDYVCPYCSKPLYRQPTSLFRTGECPMCKAILNDF